MSESIIAKADRAFVEEDYEEALQLYSEALRLEPTRADVFESRANTLIKLENWLEAAADASKAIELEPSSCKAYLRKGVACFHLEEYESAKESFEHGSRLAPDNKQLKTWIRKCDAELEEEAEASADRTANHAGPTKQSSLPVQVPAAEPTPSPSQSAEEATQEAPQLAASTSELPASHTEDQAHQPLAKAAAPVLDAKYRHQWYQLQNKVTVDIYAKGLNKEQVSIDFGEQKLSVRISAGSTESPEEDYCLEVDLYGKVQPQMCRYEVLRTKVEITMTKADSTQWGSLEKSTKVAAPNYSNVNTPPVAGQYPSSYVKKPKDWNKLEAEVKKQVESGELEDGDPLNSFFKKIFSQGDEDQRRAMMKSFVESNGTVLSTNWDEVGAKKIECTPPDGMEARKWQG